MGLTTGRSKGTIVTFRGFENNQAWVRLERTSREYADSRGGILLLSLTSYVRVRYTDRLGELRTDYIRTDPGSGFAHVDASLGRRVFDLDEKTDPLSIHSATPREVIARWSRTSARVP